MRKKLLIFSLFLLGIICSSLALAAISSIEPSKVFYKSTDFVGKYLFINHPELITKKDLADKDLGNKTIYSRTLSKGWYRLVYEHKNGYKDSKGYGRKFHYTIRLSNQTLSDAKIRTLYSAKILEGKNLDGTLKELGKTYDTNAWANMTDLWVDFFTTGGINISSSKQWQTLKPNKVTYFNTITNIEYDKLFSGMLVFYTDKNVKLDIIAYENNKKVNFNSIKKGEWEKKSDSNPSDDRVYKGISNYYPQIDNSLTWTINDNTPKNSYLPVTYTNSSMPKNTESFSGWFTHETVDKNPKAVEQDLFSFLIPMNGYEKWIKPSENDNITSVNSPERLYENDRNGLILKYNLENWGVIYGDTITINNQSSRDRIITVKMSAPSSNNTWWDGAYVVVKTPNVYTPNGYVNEKTTPKFFLRGQEENLLTFIVPANTSLTKKISYVLSAPSSGDLYHTVKVDN